MVDSLAKGIFLCFVIASYQCDSSTELQLFLIFEALCKRHDWTTALQTLYTDSTDLPDHVALLTKDQWLLKDCWTVYTSFDSDWHIMCHKAIQGFKN